MKNILRRTFLFLGILYSPYAFLYGEKPRVAVIGGGGSGLTTAWLLDKEYDVTLYESNYRLGGHANTVEIDIEGTKRPIEAGFEFISQTYYPYFYNLLHNILKVPLHEYTLTTTFYRTDDNTRLILPPIHDGKIEWRSFTPFDVATMIELKLFIEQGKHIAELQDESITLQQFADSLWITNSFKEDLLYPLLASSWGVSKDEIKQFSAYAALKYLSEAEHIKNYQWIEIAGGTQKYIQALANRLENTKVMLSTNITNIGYDSGIYTIDEENGNTSQFEYLVIATNAKQAETLLKNIPEAEDIRSILSNIKFFKTTIAIHGDTRFMPPETANWRVVNIRYDGTNAATTVHKEWLSPNTPLFKSWLTYDVRPENDQMGKTPSPLYALAEYDHLLMDLDYYRAQKAINMVQGNRNLWFAGNYMDGTDSHESALRAAVRVASKLAPDSDNLRMLTNISE